MWQVAEGHCHIKESQSINQRLVKGLDQSGLWRGYFCLFYFYPSSFLGSHTSTNALAHTHTHTLDGGQGIVTEEGLAHPCVNSHHSVPVVSHTHTHKHI